jgi:spore coat polysaccharide biosynthesis protein SpsF
VRVSGDSPLLDQQLVARGVALFTESGADLATNVSPRRYPAGMSVEVVRTETFERIVPELDEQYDREHVTNYFYRHADRFRIESFALDVPRRDVHLAVDTPENFETISRIVGAMTRPPADYSLEDVLRLYDELAPAPTQVQP